MYVFENALAFHHIWFIKATYVLASGLASFQPQTNYTVFLSLAPSFPIFLNQYI